MPGLGFFSFLFSKVVDVLVRVSRYYLHETFLWHTSILKNLFVAHHMYLAELPSNCFKLQLIPCLFRFSAFSWCVQYSPLHFALLLYTQWYFWAFQFWFLCMYNYLGLISVSGQNVMSIVLSKNTYTENIQYIFSPLTMLSVCTEHRGCDCTELKSE